MKAKMILLFPIFVVIIIIYGQVDTYLEKKDFNSYPRIYKEIELDSYISSLTRYDKFRKGYYLLELDNKKTYLIDYKLADLLKVGSEIIKQPGENKLKIITDWKTEYFEFKNSY